jgi:hypothetical protein
MTQAARVNGARFSGTAPVSRAVAGWAQQG